MHNNSFFKSFLLLVSILLFVSCDKDYNEIGADLTVPIKINQNTSLLSGIIYENIQTKLFEDGNVKTFGPNTLQV